MQFFGVGKLEVKKDPGKLFVFGCKVAPDFL